ncbi:MAG: DUF58 domain-containing protein [Chloroflexota bacterium]
MRGLIGLIIFLLACAFLFRVDFIFYIIYVCIGIYVWSIWWVPRRFKNLKASRRFQDHAFFGEDVEIKISITNPKNATIPWLEVSESVAIELSSSKPINMAIPLTGRQTVELPYTVRSQRRGYYRVGPTQLRSGDMFGFVAEQNSLLPADYLTVYPRITPIEKLGLTSRLPFGAISSKQRLFEDPARPNGVRDYRPGDSMRQINWKVSAHTRNLVVKTLEPAINLETMIVLNLNSADFTRWSRYSTIEWSIELAASLAAHLQERRQRVGIASNGVDPLRKTDEQGPLFDEITGRLLAQYDSNLESLYSLPPNNGRAHLIEILEGLARVEPAEHKPFLEWLHQHPIPLSWGGTAIVISPKADADTCQRLHAWVKRGIRPILLLTDKSNQFPALKNRAKRLGFNAFEVTAPKELIQLKTEVAE